MPRTTSIRKKPYPTIPTPCPLRSLSKSQLLHPPASHLGVLTVNVDEMAAQMSKYMDTFEEHASIARKDPDFSNAYCQVQVFSRSKSRRILDQGDEDRRTEVGLGQE